MDTSILANLKGSVSEVHVSHSRRVTDGNYGSVGSECGITFVPAPDANIDDVVAVLDAYTKARVDAALPKALDEVIVRHGDGAEFKTLRTTAEEEGANIVGAVAKPEPVRVPDGDGSQETDVFKVDTFQVEERNGKRSAKVKGGRFQKYGLIAWPEVFKAVNIDLDALDLKKPYSLPVPLTEAVYVLDAGKAKKVTAFR